MKKSLFLLCFMFLIGTFSANACEDKNCTDKSISNSECVCGREGCKGTHPIVCCDDCRKGACDKHKYCSVCGWLDCSPSQHRNGIASDSPKENITDTKKYGDETCQYCGGNHNENIHDLWNCEICGTTLEPCHHYNILVTGSPSQHINITNSDSPKDNITVNTKYQDKTCQYCGGNHNENIHDLWNCEICGTTLEPCHHYKILVTGSHSH